MVVGPDPADIQGLVRRPYRYQLSCHLLFEVTDAAAARRALGALLPRITTGADDVVGNAEPLLNAGVTWTGLLAMGAIGPTQMSDARQAFPDAFVTPAVQGDWDGRLAASDVHLAVQIHCRTEAALKRASADVRALAKDGLAELRASGGETGAIEGQALSGGLMHFDVLDGISEPAIDWDDVRTDPLTIDLRHVLLGYSRDPLFSHPNTEPWSTLVRNGTYGVMQVIYQDVAAFEAYLDLAAPSLAAAFPGPDPRRLLRAKMLGRWDDGTPLALSPSGPDPSVSRTAFGYADDPGGLLCPMHAHIRIANRRDEPLSPIVAAGFPDGGPHLLRRGLPYGPRLDGREDDGVDRGLVGFFLCANLEKQFLMVQRWVNKADFSDVFDDLRAERLKNTNHLQDMIMAERASADADHGAVVPSKTGPIELPPLPAFTKVKGTLFLLLPGLAGLRAIAGAG